MRAYEDNKRESQRRPSRLLFFQFSFSCFARSDSKTFLEDSREVRDILKAYIETGIGYTATAFQQITSRKQTMVGQPPLG